MSVGDWIAALTWRDALDFTLLFALVYWLLRRVHRTRAAPVLAAVAAFGVVAWVVRALDLVALATLLRYVFDSIIILLIVVFHQELRRLLLRLGEQILPARRRQAAASAVGELIGGLERLQRAHLGALIVLEGEQDVLAVLQNRGVEVDAPLRAETLVAYAIPHRANPTHDGAMVIQRFRIARVGAICPLSVSVVDKSFGTRHRAALGISEETDALVLVVSEERAEVRVCHRSSISAVLSLAEVEDRIAWWLSAPRSASPSASSSSSSMERMNRGAVMMPPTGPRPRDRTTATAEASRVEGSP